MAAQDVIERFAKAHGDQLAFAEIIYTVAVSVMKGSESGKIYRVEIVKDYGSRPRYIARYWSEEEDNDGRVILRARNDLPWVDEQNPDEALAMALGFIAERTKK